MMLRSFAINIMIAVIWLLLSPEPSSEVFVVGFLIGFIILTVFRPVMGSQTYVRRSVALLMFALVFLREFLLANAKVAWTVLFRSRESLHPNFVTYDVSDLRPFEILLLSYCITLTPGTTTVDVSTDFQTLIVHALEADDPDAIRRDIGRRLKTALLRFSR
jgi:multicomponent Na+:H+ antiporter subunit E